MGNSVFPIWEGFALPTVQQVKHQHFIQKWKKIILAQHASGLSAMAFCRREDINIDQFYYWQRQIRRELITQKEQQETVTLPAPAEPVVPVPQDTVQFVPLKPAKPAKKHPAHHLEIQCGPARIVVLEDTPPDLLRQTLCVLRDVFPPC